MHINRGISNWVLKECLVLIAQSGLIGSLMASTKYKADFQWKYYMTYITLSLLLSFSVPRSPTDFGSILVCWDGSSGLISSTVIKHGLEERASFIWHRNYEYTREPLFVFV